jgi:hypothetical protein
MHDWKNWKSGAKIGFVYGLICALYFTPVLFSQFSPTPDHPIRMCEDPCISWYKIIGFFLFIPIIIPSLFFWLSINQDLTLFQMIIVNFFIDILLGTTLGAVVGYISKKEIVLQ